MFQAPTSLEDGRFHILVARQYRLGLCALPSVQKGGQAAGPSPVDRGKSGSKRHVAVDREGTPLAVVLTAANVNDLAFLLLGCALICLRQIERFC